MGLRYTNRSKAGPLRFNMGAQGLSSVSMKAGPFTWRLWSRRQRAGMSSVDLPGHWSWRPSARRRSRSTSRDS